MGELISAKQVGMIDENKKIYIEDYVVSYLTDKKAEAIEAPVKAALYGRVEKEQDVERYIVYGAVCVKAEETQEELKELFFGRYELIGYVNIYGVGQDNHNVGYHIFFDDNEAMQDYLLYCNADNKRNILKHEVRKDKHNQQLLRAGILYKAQSMSRTKDILHKLKILLIGGFCIIGAVAVTTIDDYQKMKDFSATVVQALSMIENQNEKILLP